MAQQTETPGVKAVEHLDTHVVDVALDEVIPEALSPWCPESMVQEVALSAASTEYDTKIPGAFRQANVESAFQAQHTESRLVYVTCVAVGSAGFWLGQALIKVGNQGGPVAQSSGLIHIPASVIIGVVVGYLALSVGLIWNRAKIRNYHFAVQHGTDVVFSLVFLSATTLNLLVFVGGEEVEITPDTCIDLTLTLTMSIQADPFGAAYTSGIVWATGTFVLAQVNASLWTFAFSVLFAVITCMVPDAGVMAIAATIPSAFVFGGISRQILLQHRFTFAAQVTNIRGMFWSC